MKRILLATLPTLLLSACAGLGGASPAEIARLPVVIYGQPAPADTDAQSPGELAAEFKLR